MLKYLPIAALASIIPMSSAMAQTATTTFSVQITISAECQINSASTLNFGTTGVINANIDSSSALAVQCTNSTAYNIGLDAGVGVGATIAARRMTGPASATVQYSLYQDAGRTTLWGPTIGTNTVAATGNGSAQNYTVYGRVPPQGTSAAGAYSDTVTVTVTY